MWCCYPVDPIDIWCNAQALCVSAQLVIGLLSDPACCESLFYSKCFKAWMAQKQNVCIYN